MGDKNFISDYMTSVSVIRQFLQEFGAGNLNHNARALIARLVEKDILCVYSEDFFVIKIAMNVIVLVKNC